MSLELHRGLIHAEEAKKEHLYAISSDGDHLEGERNRLNFQHNALISLLDKKLIYAPVTFTEGDHILDCGTGTGIWATSVANAFPNVVVEGADISRRFFPIAENPSPVAFHNLSTFDLPPKWENRFKLANQRLMISCFNHPQWDIVLKGIHQVLQPGGWVQLVEFQQSQELSVSHPKHQKVLNLVNTMVRERGFLLDPGAELEEMLRRSGFKNVSRTHRAAPLGEWGGKAGRETRTWLQGAYMGMKDAILQAGAAESGEEFDRLMKEGFEECNVIPGAAHRIEIICGQKEA